MVYIIIIISLFQKSFNPTSGHKREVAQTLKKELFISIKLSVLFGLGWGVGLLATQALYYEPIIYTFTALFIFLTAYQGMFVFIIHCIHSTEVRKQWKKWLFATLWWRKKNETSSSTDGNSFAPVLHGMKRGSDHLHKSSRSSSARQNVDAHQSNVTSSAFSHDCLVTSPGFISLKQDSGNCNTLILGSSTQVTFIDVKADTHLVSGDCNVEKKSVSTVLLPDIHGDTNLDWEVVECKQVSVGNHAEGHGCVQLTLPSVYPYQSYVGLHSTDSAEHACSTNPLKDEEIHAYNSENTGAFFLPEKATALRTGVATTQTQNVATGYDQNSCEQDHGQISSFLLPFSRSTMSLFLDDDSLSLTESSTSGLTCIRLPTINPFKSYPSLQSIECGESRCSILPNPIEDEQPSHN